MQAFGIRVLAYSPSLHTSPGNGVRIAASLDELLARADVVSLHAPLTPATRGLIDARALSLMRPGSYLVNTSRGAIVETAALADALRSGHLGGAALDVLPTEPPDPGDPIFSAPNLIMTPHAAFDSVEAVAELQRKAASNVADVLLGRCPAYLTNPQVLASDGYRQRTRALEAS
jgi:D-3-phosphoglycerate dehydrogenase / 2-oxoglutarate reductase